MKKTRTLFTILIAFLLMFTAVGCFDDAGDTFEISGYPTTTYVAGQTFEWNGLKVKINSVETAYGESGFAGVSIPADLEMEEPGTYTAVIRYGELTASFQYTITDALFANGNGTKENPYQVSTQAQLLALNNLRNESLTYYELVNDITMANSYGIEGTEVAINVYLDGNGYSIKNVNNALFCVVNWGYAKSADSGKAMADIPMADLTGYSGRRGAAATDFTNFIDSTFYMKDLNIYMANSGSAIIEYYSGGTVVFDNVDVYGKMASSGTNFSAYMHSIRGVSASEHATVKFLDCQNYADILGSGRESAVLIGQYAKNTDIYLVNTQNYATVTGQGAAMVIGNGISIKSDADLNVVVDAASGNYGKILSTLHAAGTFIARNDAGTNSNLVKDYATIGIKRYEEGVAISELASVASDGFEATFTKGQGLAQLASLPGMAINNTKDALLDFTAPTDAASADHYVVTVRFWMGGFNPTYTNSHGQEIIWQSGELANEAAVDALGLHLYFIRNSYNANVSGNAYMLASDVTIVDGTPLDTATVGANNYYVWEPVLDGGQYICVNGYVEYCVTAYNSEDRPLYTVVTRLAN